MPHQSTSAPRSGPSSNWMTDRRRFAESELEAIYSLAKTNIPMEIWLEKFKAAQDSNLDDPRLVDGLMALVGVGILTEERMAEILA